MISFAYFSNTVHPWRLDSWPFIVWKCKLFWYLSVSIEPSIGVLGGLEIFKGKWKKWGCEEKSSELNRDKMITTYLLPLKSGNCKNCPFRFHRVTMVGNPSSTSASQLKRIGEKSLDNIVKSVGSVRNRNPENRCWEAEDERKPAIKKGKGKQSSLINWIRQHSLPFFRVFALPLLPSFENFFFIVFISEPLRWERQRQTLSAAVIFQVHWSWFRIKPNFFLLEKLCDSFPWFFIASLMRAMGKRHLAPKSRRII